MSHLRKGWCGFYISGSVIYINRTELDKKHKGNNNEFEAKWIEVVPTKRDNITVGFVYRHPRLKYKHFLNYLKRF